MFLSLMNGAQPGRAGKVKIWSFLGKKASVLGGERLVLCG